jgi:hypothetical protein
MLHVEELIMLRATCTVLGFALLLAPAPADVDAVSFATAFRAGAADRYKNKQISGTGVSFHGAIKEKIADGSTRTSLVMTLGAVARDGKLTPVKTWDEFVAAERAGTTLVVALSGGNLPEPSATGPATYEFSGVYDGQVRTIMRPPQADTGSEPADAGPCPGERPVEGRGQFYCAPLLTGATATLVAHGLERADAGAHAEPPRAEAESHGGERARGGGHDHLRRDAARRIGGIPEVHR